MEILLILQRLFSIIFTFFVLKYARKILNWAWLTPKRLEKCLREQGLDGNSYRLLFGDMKDMSTMSDEAKSKPMSFVHDIVFRATPFTHKIINNFGKDSFSWLGTIPAVLINDPELIREIMSKSYIYQKAPGNPFNKLIAQGLASYENEKWAKHRRLINPAFHQEKLKNMLPAFYLSCDDMLSKWEKIISSEECCELDVWPYLQTLTSDALSRTLFGSNYEEGKKIFELQKEQITLLMQIVKSNYGLILGWRFLPTKRFKRMREIVKGVNSSIHDIVSKKMNAIEAGEANNDDLLGILLTSSYKDIQEDGTTSSGMSIKEIIEECKLFYFAGQENTSVLLVWTMILLSKHSEWQARAREEVLNVFKGSIPDFDELNHLKIVTMILYEVLRLYSPGVMLSRMTSTKTELGKLSIPAGVLLLMPILSLHHDTEIWGDDANEFKPERFKEGISKASKGGQPAFFPFGWGPRMCIGQSFAMLEAKMALAMMLKHFSFELSPSYAHAPLTVVFLQPQHGAPLRLRKI